MFTGLVLGMGNVVHITPSAQEARITIRPLFSLQTPVKGESIAVNGACLSIERFDADTFTVYASHETLRLTNISSLKTGSTVNLERALTLGSRLGGHMVSGHVDALASLEKITPAQSSLVLHVRFPEEFSPLVIPKGSVALDGISLTVNHCGSGTLDVNVIPETQGATTIKTWAPGRILNFETDLIGKYVQRMLGPWQAQEKSGITLDFLRDNGF